MSKNEKNEGKNLDNAQLIKEIKGKVLNYYLGKTDGEGELNKEKVLKFMQTDKFLDELNQWYNFNDKTTVNKIITAVVEKFIQRNKESEDKCASFVNSIANFTNEFSFLINEYDAYKTIYSIKGSKNLPEISDYNKFLDLKTKINNKMITEYKTEAEVIRDLLHTQKSKIQLDTAELMILRRRIDVIDGKNNIKSKKENNTNTKHMKSQKNHSANKTGVSQKKHIDNKQDSSKKAQPAKKAMSLKEAKARLMANQKSSKK